MKDNSHTIIDSEFDPMFGAWILSFREKEKAEDTKNYLSADAVKGLVGGIVKLTQEKASKTDFPSR